MSKHVAILAVSAAAATSVSDGGSTWFTRSVSVLLELPQETVDSRDSSGGLATSGS